MIFKCPGCGTNVLVRMQLSASPKGTAFICRSCGHWYLGYTTKPSTCEFCGSSDFAERECNRPACPECTRRMFQADEEVRMGGAYWKCDGCGSEGYLDRRHPVAVRLRVLNDVLPPKVLVIRMGRCPHCSTKPPLERKVGGTKIDSVHVDEISELPLR